MNVGNIFFSSGKLNLGGELCIPTSFYPPFVCIERAFVTKFQSVSSTAHKIFFLPFL